MTTIAFDGRFLAADSRAVAGDCILPQDIKKIAISADSKLAYAHSGYHAFFAPWIAWHDAGQDPKHPPANSLDEGSGNFLVFSNSGGIIVGHLYGLKIPHPVAVGCPDAWGSGSSFAIGALRNGASARQAVSIAADCDPFSGGEVVVVDLKTMEYV